MCWQCVLGSPFPPQKRAWIRGYMYTVYSTTYSLRMHVYCKDAGVLQLQLSMRLGAAQLLPLPYHWAMFLSHLWQPWVCPEVATFGNLLRHKVAKSGNFPAGCQKWQLLDVPINDKNKSQLDSIIGNFCTGLIFAIYGQIRQLPVLARIVLTKWRKWISFINLA